MWSAGLLLSSCYFSISRQEIRHKTRVASGTLRAENACVSAASRARKRYGRYFILKPQKMPFLECNTLSHKNSSTETERAFAKDTIVGKLNLELPVSMLLMCVVESDAFSANASCVKSALMRAIFMRLPIAL